MPLPGGCGKGAAPYEAAQDPWIQEIRAAMAESGWAVAAEFGSPEEEIRAYAENLMERLTSEALLDCSPRIAAAD